MVAVPADHPLARCSTVAFRETLAFDHVAPFGEETLTQLLNSAAAETGKAFRPHTQVLTFDSACRVVQANLAIAIVPEAVMQSWTSTGRLCGVPLDDPWAHQRLHILVRDFRTLPAEARRLVEYLVRISGNRWREEDGRSLSPRAIVSRDGRRRQIACTRFTGQRAATGEL